ncbi:diguanylate cyclase (GGDEF) domain-containing protein [Ruminococcus sp. YE71]|uniref:GGDEF domain-containing protein n=1 Tax=unclassified Ruminococcus TaxID=2608920 RepID=UPI00089152A1|nr:MULTISPECIES: GGDEF domain-containing protein [unclassified Ruminococcus]SDA17430.1 diguanylate cyclase (GGDEF) domain-containing protein [Ruminococcus sp. YE78]SFW26796.1 diguanylate cyclase (GGDEF) domain-containing protein [Ruminococcus sp. YE71]
MKLSLGRKIVILVISVAVLLIITCIIVSGVVVRRLMYKEYIITADSMAGTVAAMVDGDKMEKITEKVMAAYNASELRISNEDTDDPNFEKYQDQFLYLMGDKDYIEIRDTLRTIQDISEVDCVYTLYVLPDEKEAVYIVDAAHQDIVTPGCFDHVEKSCYKYLNDLEQGFPAFITDTKEYGWVATSCMPIHNSEGDVVCFAAVDLSMNDILGKVQNFLYMLSLILILLTILICIIAILYVKKKIVKPINLLSEAAGQYGQKQVNKQHHEFGDLKIHTGDEIEVLLNSMIKMEKDIDRYIDNLSQTRAQLSSARQQADDMHELAHMDALTGIRNKLAYDKEIARVDEELKNGAADLGIAMIDLNFLKNTNDTYGHECGNEAIKQLSRIICETFVHSPVFRIGGDEFAVILRNNDYENIDALAEEFNSRLNEAENAPDNEPWEKISAAFGYALYDKDSDLCTHDVFKRADRNMYDRKKEMKALRK